LPLDPAVLKRIVHSMEAGNLVVLCGAGLSRPEPSRLMLAREVCNSCYDKHAPVERLDPDLREDLDRLAEHFFDQGEFEKLFLATLVPWKSLAGRPNAGHAAIGDLLMSGAVAAVLSSNYDTLIESFCNDRRFPLMGALDGIEAVAHSKTCHPLLKFHGCMNRGRYETLWTQAQLDRGSAVTKARIESCKGWMGAHLPNRDLLVVGFWTDWGYLNDVLADALDSVHPTSVTVINTGPSAGLAAKAPKLWATLSAAADFQHVDADGDVALTEIRRAFCDLWIRKLYDRGAALYRQDAATASTPLPAAPSLPIDEAYALRLDCEGLAGDDAARQFEPTGAAAQTAFMHMLLATKARRVGSWYDVGGRTVRVVHGAGEGLSTVKDRFVEAPSVLQSDIVICAGAIDLGLPGAIVPSGSGASTIRPASGGRAEWMTLEQGRTELRL
jgi:hypothetical protein